MKLKHLHTLPALAAASIASATSAASLDAIQQRMDMQDTQFLFYTNLQDDFSVLAGIFNDFYSAYQTIAPEAPPFPVDFQKAFQRLGLTNIAEFAIASDKRTPGLGFRNESIITFDGAPSGLFLLQGTANRPFTSPSLSPAGIDLLVEASFSAPQLLNTILEVVTDVMGPMGVSMVSAQLGAPLGPDGLTASDIINALNTRITFAIDIDGIDFAAMESDPDAAAQMFASMPLYFIIEGFAPTFERLLPLLAQTPLAPIEDDPFGAWSIALPIPDAGISLSLLISKLPASNDLMIALNAPSRDVFLNAPNKLLSDPAFAALANAVPTEGTSLTFVSESFSKLGTQSMAAAAQQAPAELQPVIANVMNFMQRYAGPTIGVSKIEADAVHSVGYAAASYKASFATGLLLAPAAIAIPAFTKVRAESQKKAITNNLRIIASAAQQYMLETGSTEVSYAALIEAGYFDAFDSVAGEAYETILISAESTEVEVVLEDGSVISYSF